MRKLILGMLAGMLLPCVSCGSPAGPGDDAESPDYIAELSSGIETDASALSGHNLYLIFSVMPSAKPESDSGFVPDDPRAIACSLYSTAVSGTRSSVPVTPESAIPADPAPPAADLIQPFPAQTASDTAMRERENALLALPREVPPSPEGPSLSVLPGASLSRAPAAVGVGTVWSGVKIEHTGAVIDALCSLISDHSVFYVDSRDAADPDLSVERLALFASAFEGIYDVCRARFGTESDTDGNGNILVVFTSELSGGFLGCFNADDKFSAETSASSNEGDILYLSAGTYSADEICATLAHEFQHMIYFDEHYSRGATVSYSWLNEALSQAAEFYSGYQYDHLLRISLFLSRIWDDDLDMDWSDLSLTHWTILNYGYGAVFVRYLIGKYGDGAIKNMCATDKAGIEAVEAATGTDFNVIFAGFLRALVLSGTSSTAAPADRFVSLDLHALQPDGETPLVPESQLYTAGNSLPVPAYPYSIHFYKCAGTFNSVTLNGAEASGTLFGFDP